MSDLVERLREIAKRLVAEAHYGVMTNEQLEDNITVALLSARRERLRELEGEHDTATRALAVLDKIAWLAAEEDSWFGNENDIAVQRAAAERHRAALSKTEEG